jgi:NADH-quinone oxidoreductase subunit J
MGERIAFVLAALSAVGSGLLVITLRNPFQAAVALMGTLVSVAVIFVLLAAPFLAAVQVIVYAGAIVVLFLFVIAYLGDRGPIETPDRAAAIKLFGWIAAAGLFVEGIFVVIRSHLAGIRANPKPVGDIGSPKAIGDAFLNSYLVPFEATSLLLLVAAVGAVLLAKRAVQMEGGR